MFIVYLAITVALGFSVFVLRRKRLANLALLLFTFVFCLTGLEAYYRFLYAESDGFGRLSKNFSNRYYKFDTYGLRASNLPVSETNDNLIVVGDSYVFGAGLKSPSERFSDKLAAHYPNLHVINIGLPGWDTKTETAQLTKYLGNTRAKIPLVVLAYFFNDVEEDVTTADLQRMISRTPPVQPTLIDSALQWLSNYSHFVELFYYRIGYPRLVRDRLERIQLFYQDPAIMERHLTTLERFRSTTEKQYSARLLIIILPFLHSEELLHKDDFYDRFRHALRERDFNYIDMQPVFGSFGLNKLRVNRFDPHMNAFANQLITDQIVRYIETHPDAIGKKPFSD